MEKNAKYKDFLLKFGYWAAILLVAVLFIKYLLGPLAPFLIALSVVLMAQPVVRKLDEKFKMNKKFSSVMFVILCYLVIAGLFVLIIAGTVSVVVDWAQMIPEYFAESIQPGIINGADRLLNGLNRINPELGLSVEQAMPDIMSSVSGSVTNLSMSILSWAAGIGTKIPGFMLATIICIISTVFLALDYEHISKKIMSPLPQKLCEVLSTSKRALGVILGKYARSYAVILLMTFTEIIIGLLILRIKDAASIAALIAVFDILPIVGSGMILAPWAVIAFIQRKIGLGFGITALWAIVIVVREIAEPKIVGKQVGLHPLATLMCLWVGLKLGGGLGMFALPISLLIILDLKAEGIILNKPENAPGRSQNEILT